jgi:phosphomannomutase
LAEQNISCKSLRNTYPNYYISKNKIDLDLSVDISKIFETIQLKYSSNKLNAIDGLKIHFDEGWVHLRRSNTEPIIRIYSESTSQDKAEELSREFINQIKQIL